MTNSYKGEYSPKNKSKYKGKYPVFYRSLLELTFMRWCDGNSKILEWGAESVIIAYIKPTDGKPHRYFVDFNLTLLDEGGRKFKYLVEVKPAKKLLQPQKTRGKKQSTLLYEQTEYAINMAKFSAAKQYCAERNMKFMILTEEQIKGLAFGL